MHDNIANVDMHRWPSHCAGRRWQASATRVRVADSMLSLACMPAAACRSPWEVPFHGWWPLPTVSVSSADHLVRALSAALSRLYVRVLRPDQKWCTLRHRAGARIQLRHRDMDADARESCTQCATIGDEPFVTLSSLPRMQLATTTATARAMRETATALTPHQARR